MVKTLLVAALLLVLWTNLSVVEITAIASAGLLVGFALGRRTKRHGVSAPTFFRQESGTDSPMYQFYSKLLGMAILLLVSAGVSQADARQRFLRCMDKHMAWKEGKCVAAPKKPIGVMGCNGIWFAGISKEYAAEQGIPVFENHACEGAK